MKLKTLLLVNVVAVVLVTAAGAGADIITLTDRNSTVVFDTTSSTLQNSWRVDGRDYLTNQGFWYRIGEVDREWPVKNLGLVGTPVVLDTNGDFLPDYARMTFGTGPLVVELTFPLAGGASGSHWSSMGETIKVKNTGTTRMGLHFFQYADFDLTDGYDTVEITGAAGKKNTAHQTGSNFVLSEAVDSPEPTHYEASVYPTIISALSNTTPTTLSDNPGPATGDASWAFQWDFSLAAGQEAPAISKVQHLEVPEPASLVLMAVGATALVKVRRRKHGR